MFSQLWGIEVRNNRGVQISKMSSRGIFAQYRLRVGDYIIAFNGMPIDNIDDLQTMLQQAKSEHRDRYSHYTTWRSLQVVWSFLSDFSSTRLRLGITQHLNT